jgi:hypothetical protein
MKFNKKTGRKGGLVEIVDSFNMGELAATFSS